MSNLTFPDLDLREVEELPQPDQIEFGEVLALSLSAQTTPATHGLHRFPAKFVPQVPRWALASFASASATVVDPFVGSGTTVVEALRFPVTAVGLDIDPLACAIATAKTSPPPSDELQRAWANVTEYWAPRRPKGVLLEGVPNAEHWFSRDVQAELHGFFAALDHARVGEDANAFLLVLLSSVLRRVSRADDQSMKTYVSGTNPKTAPPLHATLSRAFDRAVASVRALEDSRHPDAGVPRIERADARRLPFDDSSVDLLVTSPPYLDSVDYQDNLFAEYLWLGPLLGVGSRADLNVLRRSVTGAKRPLSVPTELPEAVRSVLHPDRIAPQRRSSVMRYLHDLDTHFREASRVLRPDARYVLVVGNSKSRDGEVPVHEALLRLAAGHRLELEHAFGYRVRRHSMRFPRRGRGGIILVDWVLVLRRVNRAQDRVNRLPVLDWTLPPDAVAH